MGMDLGDGIGIFEDSTLELKEGMVITVHPHILTEDGKEGLLLGDTFVIGQNGAAKFIADYLRTEMSLTGALIRSKRGQGQ